MINDIEKVDILMEALPYIRRLAGRTVTVKYGGSAMEDEEVKSALIDDVVFLLHCGVNVVLVHGGGKAVNKMLSRVGIEARFVNGLRYTDADTMEIVQQVLCGKVNKELCSMFTSRGVTALGLCGLDGGLLRARRVTDSDLGLVGEVTGVNAPLLTQLLNNHILPVISSVAMSDGDGALNVNADPAAAAVAIAMRAERLILLTDVPGVLRDKNDPSTLIPVIKSGEVDALKADGTISGGMLPKIDCCAAAVRDGVKSAAIVDGRVRHSILTHLFSEGCAGTMIV